MSAGRERGLVRLCGFVTVLAVGCASNPGGQAQVPDMDLGATPATSAQGSSVIELTAGALPISVEPREPTDPEALATSVLMPASCLVVDHVATAIGTFGTEDAPDAYMAVGAVVELYVYGTPSEPAGQGAQLARLRDEATSAVRRRGRWVVTVPLEPGLGPPANCQVSVQPLHASSRPVSASRSPRPDGMRRLRIGVRSVGASNPEVPAPSVLLPQSCVVQDDVVTAVGTFASDHAGEERARSGAVVELYVYASPSTSSPAGMQMGDLSLEHPYPMWKQGPWTVTVPVDATLGPAIRCSVEVQPTHHFEQVPNAY